MTGLEEEEDEEDAVVVAGLAGVAGRAGVAAVTVDPEAVDVDAGVAGVLDVDVVVPVATMVVEEEITLASADEVLGRGSRKVAGQGHEVAG